MHEQESEERYIVVKEKYFQCPVVNLPFQMIWLKIRVQKLLRKYVLLGVFSVRFLLLFSGEKDFVSEKSLMLFITRFLRMPLYVMAP